MQYRFSSPIATLTTIIALGGLLLIAWAIPPPGRYPPPDYWSNLAKWRAAGVTSYELTEQNLCECETAPVHVTVKNGKVIRLTTPSGTAIPWPYMEDRADWALTIEGTFSDIANSYAQNHFAVAVTYDPKYGMPLKYYKKRTEKAFDDDVTHIVTNFTPIHGG